jgi:hypothetical protein
MGKPCQHGPAPQPSTHSTLQLLSERRSLQPDLCRGPPPSPPHARAHKHRRSPSPNSPAPRLGPSTFQLDALFFAPLPLPPDHTPATIPLQLVAARLSGPLPPSPQDTPGGGCAECQGPHRRALLQVPSRARHTRTYRRPREPSRERQASCARAHSRPRLRPRPRPRPRSH